jgi:hypothetical protein
MFGIFYQQKLKEIQYEIEELLKIEQFSPEEHKELYDIGLKVHWLLNHEMDFVEANL